MQMIAVFSHFIEREKAGIEDRAKMLGAEELVKEQWQVSRR